MTAPPEASSANEQPRYRAFLSYSHADTPAAARLHRWLETYRIPPRLVGLETPRGRVPRRLTPIFRDRNELPASSDLNEEVRNALAASACLIVLCSPEARRSRWVDQEIRYFREKHPDRPILAGLLHGEPEDAFPPSLTDAATDREAEEAVREPAAADFRRIGDGKLARLRLVAGLTGIGLDELVQRDAQRQLRRVTAITLVSALTVVVLSTLLFVAINARNEADRQRQQAEGLIEFMLTDLRTRLEGVGRLDVLESVNTRALDYYAAQGDLDGLPAGSLDRRARVLQAMGEDDQKRGRLDAALMEFSEAHRATGALLAEMPNDPQRVFAHAQSEFWIGYTDYQRNRYAAARPHFTAYRALAEKLVKLQPGDAGALRELGYAQGNICSLELAEQAHPPAGLDACRSALAAMEQAARSRPGDAGIKADLANRHAWLADALNAAGNKRDALAERQQQATIMDDLLRIDPANAAYRQDWMLSRYSMATLLSDLGDKTGARGSARLAMQAANRLIATDPDNRDWLTWRLRILQSFPDLKTEK